MHVTVRARLRATTTAVALLGTLAAAPLAGGQPASASPYHHDGVVSATPAAWTPHLLEVEGRPKPMAYAVAEAGDQMVVGGRFSAVENGTRRQSWARSNVVAFDATDGTVHEGFDPVVDGEVWAVVSDGTSVYLGGGFTTVDGVTRPALAKLDLATGDLDPAFRPAFTGGRVSDLALHDGRLVVAGTFGRRLVALDPATGRSLPYLASVVGGKLPNSSSAQVFKFDISPDGRHLVAVGNFTSVDGQPRPRVFMLDLGATGATLSPWNYEPLGIPCTSTRVNAIAYVQDVDFAPDSSWFSLAAFGYMYQDGQRGYQLCDSVSRFETADTDPTRPTWINYTGGDSVKSVAVTGAAVYTQGHSRWLDNPYGRDFAGPGAVERLGGGAIDPVTGRALAWSPRMPQQSGGFQILPTATGVWFATDGTHFGGKYRRGIRFAPLP